MPKIIDLTGKVFGNLTVVSQALERGNRNQIKWNCNCSCGNTHLVTGESLREGKSKSCGCLKWEPTNKVKDRKRAILRVQYSQILKRHRKKNHTSNVISFDEYVSIVSDKCYYCGNEYSSELEDRVCWTKSKGLVSDTKIKVNGVDRLDSNKGYVAGNCVPCCKHCNTAKNTFTNEEFRDWVVRIYNHYVNK